MTKHCIRAAIALSLALVAIHRPGLGQEADLVPSAGSFFTLVSSLEGKGGSDPACDGGGCDSAGCDGKSAGGCGCNACGWGLISDRTFVSLEYMQWYNKGRSMPPLVTSGTTGVLGDAGTVILFGGNDIGSDLQSGGRLTVGWWLDDRGEHLVGMRLYGNEGHAVNYSESSSGTPLLARPFFDDDPLNTGPAILPIGQTGIATGSVGINAENDILGAELFARRVVDCGGNYRLDILAGYQFNRIDDDLLITSNFDDLISAATIDLIDIFNVSNEFHAAELGLHTEIYHGCWTLSMMGKVALGNMRQAVAIAGQNTVTAGGSITTQGGMLAQPFSNIGIHRRDVLAFSPEANIRLSYAYSENISISVGYTFLYWNRVALAGDHVPDNVNSTQFNGAGPPIGPATPAFAWADTDFWVQSVDIGFHWNY